MNTFIEKPRFAILLLCAVSAYLFLFQLGGFPLTDPDEVFYAQTAKEMLNRHEWATPYIYGKPQFEKPILFYWLVEASFALFGVNEFAARLPSAVFALAGVILVYLLGAVLFNRRVALFSGLIVATAIEYIVLSRACVTDMALAVFITAGFLSFLFAYQRGKSFYYPVASLCFGLATLTKGPIGIALPAAIIVIYLAARRDVVAILRMRLISSALVFLAVTVPWYALMIRLQGREFIDVFFGFHNIVRFLEPEHELGSQFYYYLPALLAEFFPWSTFLVFGLVRSFKKVLGRQDAPGCSPHTLLLTWSLVILIFFSVSRTKLPTYIFPAFAPLAVIIAALWDEYLGSSDSPALTKMMNCAFGLLAATLIIAIIPVLVVLDRRYPAIISGSIAAGACLIMTLIIAAALNFRKKRLWSLFSIPSAMVLFLYPFITGIVPEIAFHESSKEMARQVLLLAKKDDRIGSESHYRRGLTFYTDREVTDVDRHHDLVVFLSSKERVYCVLKEKNLVQLYTLDDKPYYTKPSYMLYKLRKKCIVTNRVPENGVYITKMERK